MPKEVSTTALTYTGTAYPKYGRPSSENVSSPITSTNGTRTYRISSGSSVIRHLCYHPPVHKQEDPARGNPAIQVTYGEELNQVFDLLRLFEKTSGRRLL